MYDFKQFYINGQWVDPVTPRELGVVNPATETVVGTISMGSPADVDKAVAAARAAFESFGRTSRQERIELLEAILAEYHKRKEEVALAICEEMGAPMSLARGAQADSGDQQIGGALEALKAMPWDEKVEGARVVREPIGVVGLITPWNWPMNQVAAKVAPALAAGCTMILKPSEVSPLSAYIFSQVLHDAGVPAGVYNMINGDGPEVGAPIASHPGIDMVSFTGSTRAGIAVAKAAADTVKRVAQELGGKSPNIILDDADLVRSVRSGTAMCFHNTGQSCNAPTRMLVPADRLEEAEEVARGVAERTRVGDPKAEGTGMGPVVNEMQWTKIQGLIQAGIDEGARLVAGGTGRPEGLDKGYFIKPTVFGHVSNDMVVAREEIFGPVLVIIPYEDEEDAIRIANDTPYGLSAYISSGDHQRALRVASRIRAGMVHINGAHLADMAPFGGYKQSGNGREWGAHGVEDFLEWKSIYGYDA
ncbi:MAG: aldehyde dehydrogenase family protein [Chromatiales bacterium]|nr:aldehyde dehydrogenase family protein [Chromatiales bacterium]